MREFEKNCLIEALTLKAGNIRQVSLLLDTRRSHLYRLMRRYGLELATFRHADPR